MRNGQTFAAQCGAACTGVFIRPVAQACGLGLWLRLVA